MARRFNLNINKKITFNGHKDAIYTIINTPYGLVSAGGDGFVVLWSDLNNDSGALLAKVNNSVYSLAYSSELDILFIGHNYEGIHFIDMSSKKETGSIKIPGASFFDLKWINNTLFIGASDGRLIAIDYNKNIIQKEWKLSNERVRSIAYSEVYQHIAVGCSDNKIYIIDACNEVMTTLEGHDNSIFTLSYHPKDGLLYSSGRDNTIKLWDIKSNYAEVKSIIAHNYTVNHLSFNKDNSFLASASIDKSVRIWDAETMDLIKVIDPGRHAGHGTSINKVAWLDDNYTLGTAGDDRIINVWELKKEEL